MSDATLALPRAAAPWPVARSVVSAPGALLFLSLVVGLVALGSALLNDPDTQWHIAVGRQIWTSGAVPTTDLYSHTFFGAPWIAKEWLSQLILFAAFEAGGWRGVVVLTALVIGFAYGLLYEWLRRRLDATVALGIVLAALVLGMPHFLARPHMLVLPVILVWMAAIVGAAERGRPPHAGFALVMALWANMHGSFPLGLAMAGLLAADAVWRAPSAERTGRAWRWAGFLALATAATCLTPYGWRAALVALRMEGNAGTMSYVAEWRPLSFDMAGCLGLASLAAALIVLLPDWRRSAFRILAVALLGAMMIRHGRFISLFGVLAPLLVAEALARRPGLAAAPTRDRPALWSGVAALAAAATLVVALVTPAPSARMTPEAALQAAVAAGAHGPVYNDYDFGGFLMAHGVKTFVDGRTDQLFLGRFLRDLTLAVDGKGDAAFAALLARYDVRWALVRTGSNDAGHLSHLEDWTRVHADPVASVYLRR